MSTYTRFFTTRDGARIAYATIGQGMPLVYIPPFFSHLELMWEAPAFRAFNEALARYFTVIRYDRYGCGLSDRDRTDFSLAVDLRVLEELIDHLKLRRVALLGMSAGGATAIQYAHSFPKRVSHLLLHAARWRTGRMAPARVAVHALMRADWRLGTNSLADYLLPTGDAAALSWLARIQREATSAETAIGLAETVIDIADILPELRIPTLVMNRREDRLISLESARELAALIPRSQFVALPGDAHIAEFGDADAVIEAILTFTGFVERSPANGESLLKSSQPLPLSSREREVLHLLASGLSNRGIAERLGLSIHTVERHTVNIYAKLGVHGRAAAAAFAFQHQDIPTSAAT